MFIIHMIAFHILWRPVYWYGLFYGITFLSGYFFLGWIGQRKMLAEFPRLQNLLTVHLDSLILWIIGAIMVWGRLGHVCIYDRTYYAANISDIPKIWEWGMSFIGWVIGVIIVLLGIRKYYKLSKREFLLLGDLVLCIVPLGILLWRIGNYLNKELYGLPIDSSSAWFDLLVKRWLAVDYGVDSTPTMRINTNILQSLGEGALTLLVWHILLRLQQQKKSIRPGLISWCFFVIYGSVRFGVEYLKDVPWTEMYGVLTVSQRIMIFFVLLWCMLCIGSQITSHE